MCATAEPGRFQCGPARPGEGSSAARRARRSFPNEKAPDFLENFSRKIRRKWRKNRFCYPEPEQIVYVPKPAKQKQKNLAYKEVEEEDEEEDVVYIKKNQIVEDW